MQGQHGRAKSSLRHSGSYPRFGLKPCNILSGADVSQGGINYCSECDVVTGNAKCTKCKPPMMLDSNANACVDTCPSNYYREGSSSTAFACKKCHTLCLECYGGSDNMCISCQPTIYIHNNNQCVTSCPTVGYYQSATYRCAKCHAECYMCTGPLSTDCSKCNQTFLY